eukprot:3489659-Karenia_brevis.AAC.1
MAGAAFRQAAWRIRELAGWDWYGEPPGLLGVLKGVDGWRNGWMDGWMDGWTDGRMDGGMDGKM